MTGGRGGRGRGKGKGGQSHQDCWTWLEKGHCYHGKSYEHTRVFRYTDVCSRCGDSRASTLVNENQFGPKPDTCESMPEMVVLEKKSLKRKEM